MGEGLRPVVAAAISRARRRKGLSQRALAEAAGVSEDTIGDWENARGLPRLENLVPLATALDVSVDELLIGEEGFFERVVEEAIRRWEQRHPPSGGRG